MSTDELTARLNLVQETIRGGNATIILGPNTARNAIDLSGNEILSINEIVDSIAEQEGISAADRHALSHDDIVDYCTREPRARANLTGRLTELLRMKRPSRALDALTGLVWHRIYTMDMSNALELAYRRNQARSQTPRIFLLPDPVTINIDVAAEIEIVKLFGYVDRLHEGCYLSVPRYRERWSRSPWLDMLANDIDARPILYCGEDGDAAFLLNTYRRFGRLERRDSNLIVFIMPDLTPLQTQLLQGDNVLRLPLSFHEFTDAILRVFPHGRTIAGILADTSDIHARENQRLAISLLNDFNVLTRATINEWVKAPQEPPGGIRRFYRGDDVTWRDVADSIHADLVPYKNFRNRVEVALRSGFPGRSLFLMTSPAGLGKIVGLMSAALWLRNLVNVPILWFRSDGNLSRFLQAIRDTDFPNGVYIFIDDIANYADEFDGVPDEVLAKLCFVGTARETRWLRYGPRIEGRLTVISDQIRLLNRADAEELHDRIRRFGTLVHFHSADRQKQIGEILERSKRDLLVLVKELGLGERFERTLQSEIDELTEEQRFAYLLVCISDRIQVSLPIDLFNLSVRMTYPHIDPGELLRNIGRLIRSNTGSRALVSRHSVIAARTVENRRIAPTITMRKAIEGLLNALSQYRIPIMLHHANTGHARVFKAVVNNKFLSFTFGFDGAINIYRQYEKPFETDAFFWQQFGLTYLRADGNHRLALETLGHAAHIHHHVQILHSLAVAKLVTCYDLGRGQLGDEEFNKLRSEGIAELERLHAETQMREDMAITALVHHDLRISERYDARADRERRMRDYHTQLALYLRDHPQMTEARKQYEVLHDALVKGRGVDWPQRDDLTEHDL